MLVTLEILSGPLRGTQLVLGEGQSVVVGRTSRAGLVLNADPYVSGRHFLVECNGEAVRVRDLDSTNGTYVNQERIQQSTLADGDMILAGKTPFCIAIGDGRPGAPSPPRRVSTLPLAPPGPTGLAAGPVSALANSIRDRVKDEDLSRMAEAEDTEQIPREELGMGPPPANTE